MRADSWVGLVLPTFRCGHARAGSNVERAVVRGKLYNRCKACHVAAKAAWYRWFKAVNA